MGRYFHVLLHFFVARKFSSTFKDWAFIPSKSWENFLSKGINAQTVRICLRLGFFLGNFYCYYSHSAWRLTHLITKLCFQPHLLELQLVIMHDVWTRSYLLCFQHYLPDLRYNACPKITIAIFIIKQASNNCFKYCLSYMLPIVS